MITDATHLAIDGHRSFEDAMHAEYGGLRRVDDGRAKHRAKHTTIADGEGSPVHVLNGQTSSPCLTRATNRTALRI